MQRKPAWLKRKIPSGGVYQGVHGILNKGQLHTVCQEALCPNLGECFSHKTATFLILGDHCTRNCRFCAVQHGVPTGLDPLEPERVAQAAQGLDLKYVVITSVTRDDLPDGGAQHFAETIRAIRRLLPAAQVEVLIPDLQGDWNALVTILSAKPDVLNHNLETVPRLYAEVRPQAVYQRSLELLRQVRQYDANIPTKSGLMLGLGEESEEVKRTLCDLLEMDCRILTLGQYLQPSPRHLPVARFVTPEEFEEWKEKALNLGFEKVASGPFVRSSYHAKELLQN
ncbi:MAG: lipoyl synthase [Desulfobacteraceae bacterium]|nr:MAG: lipoyl synthase [Desulfobacteraceae bacterium]